MLWRLGLGVVVLSTVGCFGKPGEYGPLSLPHDLATVGLNTTMYAVCHLDNMDVEVDEDCSQIKEVENYGQD